MVHLYPCLSGLEVGHSSYLPFNLSLCPPTSSHNPFYVPVKEVSFCVDHIKRTWSFYFDACCTADA